MGMFEVVLAAVTYVEDVGDAESADHLLVLCMLPLAQVEFLF